ncbi:IS66 family transposase [Alicyclobacillus shizuokensis]
MLPGSRPDLESAWRFLKDGHLELDSNRSERSIRPHVLMIGA